LVINVRSNGYPIDSPYVLDALCEGIARIAKLRQHLNNDCNFIIVTKLPIRHLRDHFKKIEKQLDMQTIFEDDYLNVYRKLDANKCMAFGRVYMNKKVHIVIKPYNTSNSLPNENLMNWKKDFTDILSNILKTTSSY